MRGWERSEIDRQWMRCEDEGWVETWRIGVGTVSACWGLNLHF